MDDYQDDLELREGSTKRYLKFVAAFLSLILFVFLAYAGWYAWYMKNGTERITRLADTLQGYEKQQYERAMADTYGGKTPQETLALYIKAVEAGDYDLAVKYFIEEKREENLNKLRELIKEKAAIFVVSLKESLSNQGSYSEKKDFFTINNPGYVSLMLYPSGIWKIYDM